MLGRMKRSTSRGFTLLEVLLATAIMAVGTTSILVVIATAAGMASQRQVLLRREQVLDEARHDAQSIVNSFRPKAPVVAAPAPKAAKTPGKSAEKIVPVEIAPRKVEGRRSTRYDGFAYDLSFEPRDRGVPEKGFDVAITLRYGGGELTYESSATLLPTTILDEEFADSQTYQDERKGIGSQNQTKEKK